MRGHGTVVVCSTSRLLSLAALRAAPLHNRAEKVGAATEALEKDFTNVYGTLLSMDLATEQALQNRVIDGIVGPAINILGDTRTPPVFYAGNTTYFYLDEGHVLHAAPDFVIVGGVTEWPQGDGAPAALQCGMTGEVKTAANLSAGVPKDVLDGLQHSKALAEEAVSAAGVRFLAGASAVEVMSAALKAYPENQHHSDYSAILQTHTQALAAKRPTALLLNGNWLIGSILTVKEGKPRVAFFPLHVQAAPADEEPPVTWTAVIDAFLKFGANAQPCVPLPCTLRLA